MRVIKSDHRDAQRFAAGNRFPCDLVRVTRLDQVRPFTFQNLLDRPQVYQGAVMRCSRNERRMNEINSRAFARDAFRFLSWNDEHMFVRGRALNVRDFFMHIAFHSAAQWRIELRQIANFHCPSSRATVEGSRRVIFKVTSTGSLDFARDDGFTSPASLNIALLPWPQRTRLQR